MNDLDEQKKRLAVCNKEFFLHDKKAENDSDSWYCQFQTARLLVLKKQTFNKCLNLFVIITFFDYQDSVQDSCKQCIVCM